MLDTDIETLKAIYENPSGMTEDQYELLREEVSFSTLTIRNTSKMRIDKIKERRAFNLHFIIEYAAILFEKALEENPKLIDDAFLVYHQHLLKAKNAMRVYRNNNK